MNVVVDKVVLCSVSRHFQRGSATRRWDKRIQNKPLTDDLVEVGRTASVTTVYSFTSCPGRWVRFTVMPRTEIPNKYGRRSCIVLHRTSFPGTYPRRHVSWSCSACSRCHGTIFEPLFEQVAAATSCAAKVKKSQKEKRRCAWTRDNRELRVS